MTVVAVVKAVTLPPVTVDVDVVQVSAAVELITVGVQEMKYSNRVSDRQTKSSLLS